MEEWAKILLIGWFLVVDMTGTVNVFHFVTSEQVLLPFIWQNLCMKMKEIAPGEGVRVSRSPWTHQCKKGNIFKGFCLSMEGGGVCLWVQGISGSGSRGLPLRLGGLYTHQTDTSQADLTPHRQTPHPHPHRAPLAGNPFPPGRHTPTQTYHARQTPPKTATAAEGTHPTGMYSCFRLCIVLHISVSLVIRKRINFSVANEVVTECYTDTVPEDDPCCNPGTNQVQIFRDLQFGYGTLYLIRKLIKMSSLTINLSIFLGQQFFC